MTRLFQFVGQSIGIVLKGLLVASFLLTLLGFLGRFAWFADLPNHFRLQYMLLQVVGVSLFYLMRRGSWVFWCALFAVVNLAAILPFYSLETVSTEQVTGPRVSLMHLNVYYHNADYTRIAPLIQAESPDFLTFVEYTPEAQDALSHSGVLDDYPYSVIHDNEIGFYSRVPIKRVHVNIYETAPGVGAAAADIVIGATPVSVLVLHAPVPFGAGFEAQRDFFDTVADYRSKYLSPQVIVAGDLNTTPWSIHYPQFRNALGVMDTQAGFGIQPSWPMLVPKTQYSTVLPWLPLDHCWVSPEFITLDRSTGPPVGSDHLPVLVRLALP